MIFRLLLAVDWWRYCSLICFPTHFQSSEYASKNCFWPSSQNVVIWCLWSSCSFSQCLGGWSTVRFPNKRAGEPTQQWVSNTFPEANWLLWEGFSFSLGTQEGVQEAWNIFTNKMSYKLYFLNLESMSFSKVVKKKLHILLMHSHGQQCSNWEFGILVFDIWENE